MQCFFSAPVRQQEAMTSSRKALAALLRGLRLS